MPLSKTEIREKLEVIANEMLHAELTKDYESYYDAKEQQVRLTHLLETDSHDWPRCYHCRRQTRKFRQVHEEQGDCALMNVLCPRCPNPPNVIGNISYFDCADF
jgi:hypothetical protein